MNINEEHYIKGHKQKSLPDSGWIHPCINCNHPTMRSVKYFHNHKIYNCCFCKNCVNKTKDINLYKKIIQIKLLNY